MKPAIHLHSLYRLAIAGTVALLLGACATSSYHASPKPSIEAGATWVVAPLVNNTATPYAGSRASHIAAALLAQHKAGRVLNAPDPGSASDLPLDNGEAAQAAARSYAVKQQARYLVTGSVDEWHYKIGLDGQPAVGFTLTVTDLRSGRTLWTGAASASGSSREGVAVLAQKTLNKLVTDASGD